jgi:1,4-alpha-glucan branching enzyme
VVPLYAATPAHVPAIFTGRWQDNRPVYGTFAGVESKLDYLADLGVNAVELMPVQQFPGQSSWGYNPVFYFAPAQVYGTPEECKRLVDGCHRRGMAVILDVVPNHAWGDHPYYAIYPPLYGPQGEKRDDLNPFFHHTPPAVNMWGGVDWDHFVPETTRYFQAALRYWLQEYHVDGFRFDWVGGVDYDSRQPMQPGFNPYHGISALCWAARQAKPDVLLVGEYWPLEGTHPDKTAARLVAETEMDAVWNGEFHHILEDVMKQGWEWEKRDIWRAIGGYREQRFLHSAQVINYTASHDEVRPVHEILYYARPHIRKPDGYEWLEVALDKSLVGLVALFSAPGVPMLYAGEEFGEDTPRTIDFLPIDWPKLDRPLHRQHWEAVRRLARARRTYPALRGQQIEFFAEDFATTHLVRYRRWDDAGNVALVALNFGDQPRTCELPFPDNSRWREVVTDTPLVVVGDPQRTIFLPPWQGKIFVAWK